MGFNVPIDKRGRISREVSCPYFMFTAFEKQCRVSDNYRYLHAMVYTRGVVTVIDKRFTLSRAPTIFFASSNFSTLSYKQRYR